MEQVYPKLKEAEWHGLIQDARGRGDFLCVIDIAQRALQDHPDDLRLEYEMILAYARAGAIQEAEKHLSRLQAAGALDALGEPLAVDFAALEARLLKSRSYPATTPSSQALALRAAAAYEAVFRSTGTSFPAINAATLYYIVGDAERGKALAQLALDNAQTERSGYWAKATIAEALIILGHYEAARIALAEALAAGMPIGDFASTRRQLAWLCRHIPSEPNVVEQLPAPYVVCWETAPCDSEPEWCRQPLTELVRRRLHDGLPVLAFGGIVRPADIVVAEVFIAAGAQIELTIACKDTLCIESVERCFGAKWADRLQAVLQHANSYNQVTLEGESTEPVVARLIAQQALGLALMRAEALVVPLHGMTVGPDGLESNRLSRQDATVIESAPSLTPGVLMSRALVFGDIKGFSTLAERDHRPFLEHVIGGFADKLVPFRDQIQYTETAGDGIYVVLTDVIAAIRCCHALQQAMDPDRMASFGLPRTLSLRLGAHIGPVGCGLDRVTGRVKFIGKEVIRTARIEAITPVGQTYVTEQFAAVLHSLTSIGHACEYVGWQAMAKDFGRCRMYSLRATPEMLALLRG